MKKLYYGLGVASALGIMYILSIVLFWRESKTITDELIANDVHMLASIFNKINEDCVIIDFEHQQNYIDFLNVKSFVGSEVGPMNLMRPEKWQGPYVDDNPTVQEIDYQVVRTTKGHFIVPGPGVVLANGKLIGEDIVFDENADIQALIDDGTLMYESKPLAAPINVGS